MTPTQKFAAVVAAVIVGVSFALGVPALVLAGEVKGLPVLLTWLVPIFIDGGMLAFAVVAFANRAARKPARFEWTALGVLTAISAFVQVWSVMRWPGSDQLVGAGLAALIPVVIFAASHSVLGLVIGAAPTRRARQAQPTKTAATATAKEAAPTPARPAKAAPEAVVGRTPTTTEIPDRPETEPASRPATASPAAAEAPSVTDSHLLALRSEGLSYGAIAEATGVPLTTVKRRIKAASERTPERSLELVA